MMAVLRLEQVSGGAGHSRTESTQSKQPWAHS
jgi:hypothetical protein